MNSFARSDRVGVLIQQVISELLRKKIQDPRLKDATITEVKLSSDLRIAKIYFVVPGPAENKEDAKKGFQKALGYLKRSLGRQLNLRYMPDLQFYYDESFEYGSNIDRLLNSIKTDKGSDHTPFDS